MLADFFGAIISNIRLYTSGSLVTFSVLPCLHPVGLMCMIETLAMPSLWFLRENSLYHGSFGSYSLLKAE